MFGRKKQAEPEPEAAPAPPPRPGAKNRPTPKRKDQEAARRRPLVPDTRAETRERTKEERARARAERAKAREAMMSGDERYLAPRDKGPQRRMMRDLVDSRWNVGEILLPVMVIVLALSFIRTPWAQTGVFMAVYGLLCLGILDSVWLWRRVRKQIEAEFGEAPQKGSAMYVVMRAFQMRRTRVPRPVVQRGDEVRRR